MAEHLRQMPFLSQPASFARAWRQHWASLLRGCGFGAPTGIRTGCWTTQIYITYLVDLYPRISNIYNIRMVMKQTKTKKRRQLSIALIIFLFVQVNNLDPEGNWFGQTNEESHPNSTNIHTHGLHISSRVGYTNRVLQNIVVCKSATIFDIFWKFRL